MAKRFRQLSVWLAMLFAFSLAAPAQDAADPGSVKVPWEEFKKLLELGKDEIVLSWTEFRQILAQTEMKIVPAFELRDEKVVHRVVYSVRNTSKQFLDSLFLQALSCGACSSTARRPSRA